MEKSIVTKWVSRGKTISLSFCHKDMYIIVHADNKFHNIHSTQEIMLTEYPPDDIVSLSAHPVMRSWLDSVPIFGKI